MGCYTDVSVERAKAMIDNGTAEVVVDVREELTEYCEAADPLPNGHIPGALNYPWSSLYLQAHYRELPADKAILVYCGVGGRSALAAQFLCVNGYPTVYNMTGGLTAWPYETEQCCFTQSDCDDGLFCTGAESCLSHDCYQGSAPCPLAYTGCSEELDLCVDCPGDYDCDNAIDGADNCLTAPNGTLLGTCARTVGGVIIGTGLECSDTILCPGTDVCQKGQEDFNGNSIGDACECYADVNRDGKVILGDLIIVKNEFGRLDCATNPCQADMNADNKVLIADLVILKSQFGRIGCPMP